MLTGWQYWWNRYLGWFPLQPCRMCPRWYWGGMPWRGWQPSYQEYCCQRCYDACGGLL